LVWTALGGLSGESILLVTAGLIAIFGGAWLFGRISLRGSRQKLPDRSHSVATDLAVIAYGWLVSLLLFIPVNLAIDPASSSLFWGNVHGRLYGMFYPAAVLGLTILVIDRAALSKAAAKINLAATVALGGTLTVALLA